MGRETSITQEQVNAHADAIRATGSKPTARAIREALGGGSMATVLKFLQAWQAGQVKVPESPVVLPVALQKALVDFIGQEVAASKAELQDEILTLQQSNADLIAENERQNSLIESQGESIETLLAEKAELGGRLGQLESDLARAGDEAASLQTSAEEARTALAKAEVRLEAMPRIESDLERLRAELEEQRNLRVEAEQAAAVAEAKLNAETDKSKLIVATAEKTELQLKKLEMDLANVRQHEQSLQSELESIRPEVSTLRSEIEKARAEAKQSGEAAAELRGQLNANSAKVKS